jgi:TonB-dependent SusC/RagA subfamily outer membrane receptor
MLEVLAPDKRTIRPPELVPVALACILYVAAAYAAFARLSAWALPSTERRHHMWEGSMRFGRWILAGAAGVVLSASAAAQAAARLGTIQGRVTDVASGRPVAEAQMAIISLGRGVRASDQGVYRLAGVPAGTYQLKAIRIGFEAKSVAVIVRAGETVTMDVALKQSVTQLDVQVVTATGETQRRREQGTNVSTISVADEVPLAAQANFSSVLASRTPGVNVTSAGGSTGTGSRIRIRGANSISLSNDPLLIIDGVRVNNSSGSNSIGVGGQAPSRFDDLNPDDLESVEVIKGPAGVALYGLQAANGVIQVRTKRPICVPRQLLADRCQRRRHHALGAVQYRFAGTARLQRARQRRQWSHVQ